MSEVVRDSNVYYLPPQPPEEPPVVAGVRSTLRECIRRAWWRLRLTLIDIRLAIRKPGGRLFADDAPIFLNRSAELVERARRRPTQPARIIDFATARARLRASAEA